jgi:hypothetical protein
VSTTWRWAAFRSLLWNKESKLMPDVAFVLLTVALFAGHWSTLAWTKAA